MAIPPMDYKVFKAEEEYIRERLRKDQSMNPSDVSVGGPALKLIVFLFVVLTLPVRLTISWVRRAGRRGGG